MQVQDSNISLIVGLGNPGSQYEYTRHNAGFLVVDALAEELGVSFWKQSCGSLVAEVSADRSPIGRRVILAKPQSFMNCSGGPVKKLMQEYGCSLDELLVIHDELDIPAGSARIKLGGGAAGHNGLKSIIDKCQSRDFVRVRVGIGRPPGKMPVADFVLQEARKEAREDFDKALELGLSCTRELLVSSVEQARNKMNAS